MENIINTLKQSCEDLKTKAIISQTQYDQCLKLTKKQNWRNELKNETFTKEVDKIIQQELLKYNKYKKLVDKNLKKLKESYILSLSNDNDLHKRNIKNYSKNLKVR